MLDEWRARHPRLFSWKAVPFWLLLCWKPLDTILTWVGTIDTVRSAMTPEHWFARLLFWPPLGLIVSVGGLVGLLLFLWRDQQRSPAAAVPSVPVGAGARQPVLDERTSPATGDADQWLTMDCGRPYWDLARFQSLTVTLAATLARLTGAPPTRRLVVPDVVVTSVSAGVTLTVRVVVATPHGTTDGVVAAPRSDPWPRGSRAVRCPLRLEAGASVEGSLIFDVAWPFAAEPSQATFQVEVTDRLRLDRPTLVVPAPGVYPSRRRVSP